MLHLVFLFLISISYVKPEKDLIGVEAERLPFLFKTFLDCADKTKSDSTTMQKVMEWNFEDNDAVKKYLYCFGKETGMSDDDGFIVKDKIMKLLEHHKLVDEVGNVVDECNKLKGTDEFDTIYKVGNCFKTKSPVWIRV